jgi:ribosome-associated translation inhibitor RaiA
MDNDVNKAIDSAIDKLADQVRAAVDPQKALHFSQSALNLAQTKSVLQGLKSVGSPESSKKN